MCAPRDFIYPLYIKISPSAARIQFERDYEDVQTVLIPEGKLKRGSAKQTGGIFQFGYHPCHCLSGVCSCCTGILLDLLKTNGCMNVTYIPEEFAFELKMMINDRVLYKNTVTGNIIPNRIRIRFLEFKII